MRNSRHPQALISALRQRGRLESYLRDLEDDSGDPLIRFDSGNRSICPFHGGDQKDFAYFRGPDRWQCFSTKCPTNNTFISNSSNSTSSPRLDGQRLRDIVDFQVFLKGHTSAKDAIRELAKHFRLDATEWEKSAQEVDTTQALRSALLKLYLDGVGRLWQQADTGIGQQAREQFAKLGLDASTFATVAEDAIPGILDQQSDVWKNLTRGEREALSRAELSPKAAHGKVVWPHFSAGDYQALDGLSLTSIPDDIWAVDRDSRYIGVVEPAHPLPIGFHTTPQRERLTREPWPVAASPTGLIALRQAGVDRATSWPAISEDVARARPAYLGEQILVVPDSRLAKQVGWEHSRALLASKQSVAICPLEQSALTDPQAMKAAVTDAPDTALDPVEWQVRMAGSIKPASRDIWLSRRLAPLLAATHSKARHNQHVLDTANALGVTPQDVARRIGARSEPGAEETRVSATPATRDTQPKAPLRGRRF